jgi:hypothetical protein
MRALILFSQLGTGYVVFQYILAHLLCSIALMIHPCVSLPDTRVRKNTCLVRCDSWSFETQPCMSGTLSKASTC